MCCGSSVHSSRFTRAEQQVEALQYVRHVPAHFQVSSTVTYLAATLVFLRLGVHCDALLPGYGRGSQRHCGGLPALPDDIVLSCQEHKPYSILVSG